MAKTEKKISLTGTRGNIYDRNGNVLAYNKLSYNVTLRITEITRDPMTGTGCF